MFRFLVVMGGVGNAMLAANLLDRHAGVSLLENGNDPRFS